MENAPVRSLRDFLDLLRARGELLEVETEVDQRFAVAAFPLVTNLFGTTERASLAFGTRPRRFVERVVETAHTLLPPTFRKLWAARGLAFEGLRVGMRSLRSGPVTEAARARIRDPAEASASRASSGRPAAASDSTWARRTRP